jgi:hypothetical protein
MKERKPLSYWRVGLLSAFIGLPFSIFVEIARRSYNDYLMRLTTEEFERKGMSPPLMIDNLRGWVVPFFVTFIFVIVGLLLYEFWNNRKRYNGEI